MKIFIRMCVVMLALVSGGTVFAAATGDLAIGTTKAGATVTLERVIKDGRALVTVDDASMQPLLGLGIDDFTVNKGDKQGRVISVQSVGEVKDVPLNIVLVLDNSYSMYERDAIKPLLAGLDRVLKLVRPIDQVQMVVFDNKITTKVGNRTLGVKTFKSSDPAKLREFAKNAYSQKGLTPTTKLYEAMVAGLDLVGKMPASNPRIMVVFSDGEDLNSAFKSDEVVKAYKSAGKFTGYAIDYMESRDTNKFLTQFAKDNRGQIWKAKSEVDLLSIWENVAKGMDFAYILTYIFPAPLVPATATTPAVPAPKPVVMIFDTAALFDFDKSDLKPEGKEHLKAYREQAKEQLSRADKIKVSGHTDNIGTADYNMKLSQRRAKTVADYLKSVGVTTKMEVAGEGMSRPMFDNRTKEGQAKNRRVEVEIFGLGK
jgi:outer membrane protein OmpA-like peptidoglycan-associated protein